MRQLVRWCWVLQHQAWRHQGLEAAGLGGCRFGSYRFGGYWFGSFRWFRYGRFQFGGMRFGCFWVQAESGFVASGLAGSGLMASHLFGVVLVQQLPHRLQQALQLSVFGGIKFCCCRVLLLLGLGSKVLGIQQHQVWRLWVQGHWV